MTSTSETFQHVEVTVEVSQGFRLRVLFCSDIATLHLSPGKNLVVGTVLYVPVKCESSISSTHVISHRRKETAYWLLTSHLRVESPGQGVQNVYSDLFL